MPNSNGFEQLDESAQVVDDLKLAYSNAVTGLENARQNLRLLETRRAGLLAQERLLERQIHDAVVVAPISGTVTTKYFEAGETVPTGFAVAEIIDLSEMWIKVYVSETSLAHVKIGQDAEIHIDGTIQHRLAVIDQHGGQNDPNAKNFV